jgi:hypothetical protein
MSGISAVYETFMRTAEKVEVADFEELTVLLKRYLDPDTDFGSLLVNSELPADSTRRAPTIIWEKVP